MNSILFTLALLYLLFLRWSALIQVFLAPVADLPVLRLGNLRNLVRFLVIGLAFGILLTAVLRRPVSPLAGKWTVDRLVRNRDTVKAMAWLTDSAAWTTLYIEGRGALAFCPNPYIYDPHKSEGFQYTYDSVQHQMALVRLANRKDTARFRVSGYDGRKMQWDGIIDDDTLSMELSRFHNPQ